MNSYAFQPYGFAICLPIAAEKRKMLTSRIGKKAEELPASGVILGRPGRVMRASWSRDFLSDHCLRWRLRRGEARSVRDLIANFAAAASCTAVRPTGTRRLLDDRRRGDVRSSFAGRLVCRIEFSPASTISGRRGENWHVRCQSSARRNASRTRLMAVETQPIGSRLHPSRMPMITIIKPKAESSKAPKFGRMTPRITSRILSSGNFMRLARTTIKMHQINPQSPEMDVAAPTHISQSIRISLFRLLSTCLPLRFPNSKPLLRRGARKASQLRARLGGEARGKPE